MRTLLSVLTEQQVQALGWALLHFLWEGAVVALVMAAGEVALRRWPARVRYLMGCCCLALMLALPLLTYVVIWDDSASLTPATTFSISGLASATATMSARAQGDLASRGLQALLEPALPWFVAFWFCGVFLLSAYWLAAWACVSRRRRAVSLPIPPEWTAALRRLCQRMQISVPVRLCIHNFRHSVSVIGWLRPAILAPAAAIFGLDAHAIEAVLAHELAHIRRYDYLINLLQTAAETILFYHPAVWWVSHRVRIERENCCDELAVEVCGDRLTYARALVELEQIRATQISFAMAANGSSLLRRIQRLLHRELPAQRRVPAWLPAAWGVAILALVLFGARPLSRAFSDTAQQGEQPPAGNGPSSQPSSASSARPVRPTPLTRPSRESSSAARESDDQSDQNEDFIGGMAAAGYRNLGVDQLIELKNHGVTPHFVKELAAAGYTNIKLEKLIELRIHGVDQAFIKGMKASGFQDLSLDNLIALRIHGVDPEFIAEMKTTGFGGLKPEQYTELRIHGVDSEFVEGLKAAGLGDLPLEKILSLRIHGVDPEYIAELKKAGYGGLSAEQYQELRIHAVDGDYVHSLRADGLANLSLQELLNLRIHGVDPDFISDMKAAGYADLSAEQYKQLRIFGVDGEYVRHLREHGISHVSVEQLIRLKQAGI